MSYPPDIGRFPLSSRVGASLMAGPPFEANVAAETKFIKVVLLCELNCGLTGIATQF